MYRVFHKKTIFFYFNKIKIKNCRQKANFYFLLTEMRSEESNMTNLQKSYVLVSETNAQF